jgi:hypothetical protein
MHPARILAGSGKNPRTKVLALVRSGALVALLVVAATSPDAAAGEVGSVGEPTLSALGRVVPSRLPSSRRVPVTLHLGFRFEGPGHSATPELTSIALDVSRDVALQTTGLPSCPLATLYSSYASPLQTCAGSLVGNGRVISEVTLPGQAPATVDGRLLAFYDFAEGQPHILAQVTSGGELPLTYVIPFQIEKTRGAFGTRLHVRKMSNIQGKCRRGHPNCFAQPYTLKGVYGHISSLELSLHRLFTHKGKRESFVSADCPARGRQSVASSQFGVSLRYDQGSSVGGESATMLRRCKVSG